MIKKIAVLFIVFASAQTGQSQTILLEEDFNDGIPATWTVYNLDELSPDEDVSEFDAGWIGKTIGTDTAAASTSYYDPSGQANDYLVTPVLSIGNFSRLVWSARSVDASYPDGYQVLISTTDNLTASFTDTLLTIGAESPLMMTRSIELDLEGYANQDVYIAFQNNTNNGYILLIDNVKLLGAETARITELGNTQSKIQIYPNPTSSFIQIQSTSELKQASIYSVDGKLQLTSTEAQINVQSLENGTYFILIETLNGQESLPFVKQ